jgi:hypothetical protein
MNTHRRIAGPAPFTRPVPFYSEKGRACDPAIPVVLARCEDLATVET